jgi:hypothetical protein
MENVTMAEAKRLFSMGVLNGFHLTAGFGDEEWSVSLSGPKESWGFLITSKSKGPRIFKTLDAAVRAAREIGFKVSVLRAG